MPVGERAENCEGPAVAALFSGGRCPCVQVVMVPQVLCGCERPCDHAATSSSLSTWKCLRFSSPAESWTFQLCNRDWYAVFQQTYRLVRCFQQTYMAAVMGLFDAFCVIFRAPPAMPELSALPIRDYGAVDIHTLIESSEQQQQQQQCV